MDIVMIIAGRPTSGVRPGQGSGQGSGQGAGPRSAYQASGWGHQPFAGERPRPDAPSMLGPQRVSAPRVWSS